jgi:antitoxin component YwqK of YwqJK toxin-antitoxin module
MRLFFYSAIILIGLLVSCRGKEVFQYDTKRYWRVNGNDDLTKIKDNINVYYDGVDSLLDWRSYYLNGQMRSHVKFDDNSRILKIYEVYDTLGHRVNFGHLKNGTGYIYRLDNKGRLEESGNLIHGKRNGWWKTYHYKGYVLDSTYYDMGKMDGMGDFEFCFY